MATYPIKFVDQLRQHLRALRKKRNLTQAQLGKLLGVSQSRIAEIEANPGAVTLDKLVQVLSLLDANLALVDTDEIATDIPARVCEPEPASYGPAQPPGPSTSQTGDDSHGHPHALPPGPGANRVVTEYAKTLNASLNAETSKLHSVVTYDRLSEKLRAAQNLLRENDNALSDRVRHANYAGAAARTKTDLEKLQQHQQASDLIRALERFREQTASKIEALPTHSLPYKKGSW